MVIYADDVTLIEPITDGINPNNLVYIQEWIKNNKMELNLNKSVQMTFYRGTPFGASYRILRTVENVKILGVYWNSNLTWDYHFNEILKIASQRLYVIRTLKPLLPSHELICVYHSLICNLLLYAAPLFVWLPKSVEKKVEKFHNRAHRIICGKDCLCDKFRSFCAMKYDRACSLFTKCEANVMHPLHSLIPHRMPRSGHLCLQHVNTSRRQHSFIPWMCVMINDALV